MKNKVSLFIILLLNGSCLSVGQNLSLSLMKDSTFITFFNDYVKVNQLEKTKRGIPVILVKNQTFNKCEVVVTMFGSMSEIAKFPPSRYTFISNRLTLIYDGTQHLFRADSVLHKKLNELVKADLCDNTNTPSPNLTGQEIALKRCPNYDPQEWKLTFSNGELLKKEKFYGDLTTF